MMSENLLPDISYQFLIKSKGIPIGPPEGAMDIKFLKYNENNIQNGRMGKQISPIRIRDF